MGKDARYILVEGVCVINTAAASSGYENSLEGNLYLGDVAGLSKGKGHQEALGTNAIHDPLRAPVFSLCLLGFCEHVLNAWMRKSRRQQCT